MILGLCILFVVVGGVLILLFLFFFWLFLVVFCIGEGGWFDVSESWDVFFGVFKVKIGRENGICVVGYGGEIGWCVGFDGGFCVRVRGGSDVEFGRWGDIW